jgi:outer membrane protein assembly factor BamB
MIDLQARRRWLVGACALLAPTTFVAGVANGPAAAATAASPCFDVDQFLGGAGHAGSGMATAGITGSPTLLWTSPSSGQMPASPAIVDGIAYVADGLLGTGAIRAIDTATGAELWNAPLPGQPFGSTVAVVDGLAVVGDIDGNLTAIDTATHGEAWTVALATTISSSPAVADGVLVINAEDTVYALDPVTGTTLWTFENGGDGGYTIESSAAIVDGIVFTTSIGGDGGTSLWALDAATGDEIWSYEPSQAGLGTPAYHDGTVYAGGPGGLVAVDAETGEEVWASPVGDVFSAPAVGDDLIIAHTNRDLVAVDAATGDEVWRADTGGSWSAPTLVDDVVYIGSNGMAFQQSVQLLDAATGEQIARIEGFGSVNSPVVVTGGAAYAATAKGLIAIGGAGPSSCAAAG